MERALRGAHITFPLCIGVLQMCAHDLIAYCTWRACATKLVTLLFAKRLTNIIEHVIKVVLFIYPALPTQHTTISVCTRCLTLMPYLGIENNMLLYAITTRISLATLQPSTPSAWKAQISFTQLPHIHAYLHIWWASTAWTPYLTTDQSPCCWTY